MTQITAHNLDRISALELKELFDEQGSPIRLVEPESVPGRAGLLQGLQLVIEHSDYVPLLLTAWLISRKQAKLKLTRSDRRSGQTKTLELEYSQDGPASILKQLKDWLGL
jgi:hypothetical protein